MNHLLIGIITVIALLSAACGDRTESPVVPSAAAPQVTAAIDGYDKVQKACQAYGLSAYGVVVDYSRPLQTLDGHTVAGMAMGVCARSDQEQLAEELFGPVAVEAMNASVALKLEWNSTELGDYLENYVNERIASNPTFSRGEWFFLTQPKAQIN